MSIEEQIGNIVVRLSDLKLELADQLEQSQEELREYVTNTNFPIADRFEVWTEWCNKKRHRFTIHEVDVPLFGKMVENHEPYDYCQSQEYDWLYFQEAFEDPDLREQYGVTPEDVMERLIETNFGSFIMDW
jgi:hypothetical protein